MTNCSDFNAHLKAVMTVMFVCILVSLTIAYPMLELSCQCTQRQTQCAHKPVSHIAMNARPVYTKTDIRQTQILHTRTHIGKHDHNKPTQQSYSHLVAHATLTVQINSGLWGGWGISPRPHRQHRRS